MLEAAVLSREITGLSREIQSGYEYNHQMLESIRELGKRIEELRKRENTEAAIEEAEKAKLALKNAMASNWQKMIQEESRKGEKEIKLSEINKKIGDLQTEKPLKK